MFFNSNERKMSFGLLIMRVGLAAALLIHAVPKLVGGALQWENIGMTLGYLQTGIPANALGLGVIILETLGALSLLSGFLFRVACIIMTVLFGFYCFTYFGVGYKSLTLYSLGLSAVFFGLINTGPGRYAVAVKLERK
jgi:uncharacterized membrane protein YphA (DoxX/SURF4 family)